MFRENLRGVMSDDEVTSQSVLVQRELEFCAELA